MKPRTRVILLSVISILIVVTIVLGVTYSFMRAEVDSSMVTEVSLSSCAKITLEDTESSINLNNTYPMSKNRALQETPYSFSVSSSCEDNVGFNLYVATLNTNTLGAENIHYIITNRGEKTVLAEGILGSATNAVSDFTAEEQTQFNSGINGTFSTIYKIFNADIPLKGKNDYDLYLYVDGEVTDSSTMGKTFTAGIAVKSYDVEPTFADTCRETSSNTLACKVATSYTEDGENGLYYHDGSGTYGSQETGDNSYRYAGSNPNNYVCFGSDASTCPNDNLYRVIGVFDGQVKLIKSDYATHAQLGTNGAYSRTYEEWGMHDTYKGSLAGSAIGVYYWNDDTSTSTWSESNLNKINLNTNYLNNIGSKWSNMIATHTWQVGGATYSNVYSSPVKAAYNYEVGPNKANTTYNAKIGLMYVSDYGYAASPSAWNLNMSAYNDSTATSNNWMFMGLFEWTISRLWSDGTNFAFHVGSVGFVGGIFVNDYYLGVRPCFYLESTVVLSGGSGTAADPYRVA